MTSTMREALSEFLGTFVLILFGVGVVAQVTLGGGSTGQYLFDQPGVGPGGDRWACMWRVACRAAT